MRTLSRSLVRLALLLWLLAWMLAGCGGAASTATVQPNTPASEPAGERTPTVPAATPAATTAAPEEPNQTPVLTGTEDSVMTTTPGRTSQPPASGLAGLIFSASDVTGQADTPLPDQAIVAIPEAEAAGILGLSSPPTAEQLRFLKATIGAARPQMGVTVSDAQGKYSLALPAGGYILCVGEENTSAPASFPLRTRGCGQVSVPPSGVKTVDISSGFGEILLVEP